MGARGGGGSRGGRAGGGRRSGREFTITTFYDHGMKFKVNYTTPGFSGGTDVQHRVYSSMKAATKFTSGLLAAGYNKNLRRVPNL